MNNKSFNRTWGAMIAERNSTKIANLILAIALAVSVVMLFNKKDHFIVLPPKLDERIEITLDSADAGYVKSWGVHLASLVGNVHPGNAQFVSDTLGALLSPDAYHKISGQMGAQVFKIKKEGRRTRFTPTAIIYEDSSRKVFVKGDFETFTPGLSGSEDVVGRNTNLRRDKVYEFVITLDHGKPYVEHFDTYFGPIRDLKYLNKMQSLQNRQG